MNHMLISINVISASHAGGVARTGAVVALTEQMLTTSLFACLTKLYYANE